MKQRKGGNETTKWAGRVGGGVKYGRAAGKEILITAIHVYVFGLNKYITEPPFLSDSAVCMCVQCR